MLNPIPREVERTVLMHAPIVTGSAIEIIEALSKTSDSWARMVDTLDDLARALRDVDDGRF